MKGICRQGALINLRPSFEKHGMYLDVTSVKMNGAVLK